MDDDPLLGWGLRPVELADRALLNSYFASLAEPLSDYTFSQLYTWRNSLRIIWKELSGHLCIFANGSGDLTLLLPPIGDSGSDKALAEAFELMDDYNTTHGVPGRSRVEYASEELLTRFGHQNLLIQPMGADYVYDVNRMIDLAGGDLASKRQAKNRFLRNYPHRVEEYRADQHLADCLALLETWKVHQDANHLEEPNANSIKRSKESIATALCLKTAGELGLSGMVVYVKDGSESLEFRVQNSASLDAHQSPLNSKLQTFPSSLNPEPRTPNPSDDGYRLRGFTFGELLGQTQSSITIEKTELEIKGLAQFIFSEFCERYWRDRPLVNVGDDWGLPSLAWTKMSYRPVKLLNKFVLRREPVAIVRLAPASPALAEPGLSLQIDLDRQESDLMTPLTTIRAALKADLDAAVELEQAHFHAHSLSRRQLQYLQRRETAIFLVGEQNGEIVGDGIALIRQHRKTRSGRIYSLVVRAESRGQKIGQKLLYAMIDALAGRGVNRVYLEVEQRNAGAIRLYEQAGFRAIGVVADYYGKGKPGLHMMYDAANADASTTTASTTVNRV